MRVNFFTFRLYKLTHAHRRRHNTHADTQIHAHTVLHPCLLIQSLGLAQDNNLGIAPSSEQIQPNGSWLSSGQTAVSAQKVRSSRLLSWVPIPWIQISGLNTNSCPVISSLTGLGWITIRRKQVFWHYCVLFMGSTDVEIVVNLSTV